MKTISMVLIILLLVCIFAGCQQQEYQLIQRDSSFFITLGDYDVIADSDDFAIGGLTSIAIPSIRFDSFDEMLKDIRTGDFTDDELTVIQRYADPESGEVQINTLSELYAPIMPSDFDYDVRWYVNSYGILLSQDNGTVRGGLAFCEKDEYDRAVSLLADFEDTIDTGEFESDVQITTNTDRNATEYVWTKAYKQVASKEDGTQDYNYVYRNKKVIIYTLDGDGNTYYVKETYEESYQDMLAPIRIDMYTTLLGNYVHIYLENLGERPSIEWLAQFGLREYVETEVS